MINKQLRESVDAFAASACTFSDSDLEREWGWREYREGVRMAYLRTNEQLRELAVSLGEMRRTSSKPMTSAQHILSQYMALLGTSLCLTEEQYGASLAEGEWSLREVVGHIITADMFFFSVISWTLEQYRDGEDHLVMMPEGYFESLFGPYDKFNETLNQPLSEVFSNYETWHQRNVQGLCGIREEELGLLSKYWEDEPMTVRFRLHRFESHLRQHTIQAAKALDVILGRPTEAKRLLGLMYASLGEVEGVMIGVRGLGADECANLAVEIGSRLEEIKEVVAR
jgi:hypothetical protein